ncbi:hypothetical protein ILYODFUR_012862 [Ilyodon furcidens]|uniref:Uncharacterized protein n=1 Tax=Ilyodon furcidens TaxID=33524 RepID=A0ABV0V5F1_9TELE
MPICHMDLSVVFSLGVAWCVWGVAGLFALLPCSSAGQSGQAERRLELGYPLYYIALANFPVCGELFGLFSEPSAQQRSPGGQQAPVSFSPTSFLSCWSGKLLRGK